MLDLTKYEGHTLGPLTHDHDNHLRGPNYYTDHLYVCEARTDDRQPVYIGYATTADRLLHLDSPLLLAEDKELRAELEATKLSMANRNDDLGMEIVRLQAENERLKEENEQLKAQLAVMDRSLSRTSVNIRTRTEERDDLQAKLERCGTALDEISTIASFDHGGDAEVELDKCYQIARQAREGE